MCPTMGNFEPTTQPCALNPCARDNLLRRGESAASCLFSPLPGAAARRERLSALHTVCLQIFPHSPQTLLAIRQYSCVGSARSEEKSAVASRAQSLRAAALVFSRALFSTPSPLFGETSRRNTFPRFPAQDLFSTVLCSILGTCSAAPFPKGDGEAGKWGIGGENPEGEGG